MLSAPALRALLRGLVVIALLLAAAAARVVASAAAELERADGRMQAGDRQGALTHYRRAARWYAPASPYHVRALSSLEQIGRAAEARGDVVTALAAYRAIRGAIRSARSVVMPEPERLATADRRIAALMAELPAPGIDRGKSHDQTRAEHLTLLAQRSEPHVWWTLLTLLGFAIWVAGAMALSVRAVDADDRWIGREVRRWGVLVAAGMSLFVLGLALA